MDENPNIPQPQPQPPSPQAESGKQNPLARVLSALKAPFGKRS